MAKVVAQANMSLDGYVAKQDNTIGNLFDWLQNGDVAIPSPAGDFAVHLTQENAEHWRGCVIHRRSDLRSDIVRRDRRVERASHLGCARRGRHPSRPRGLD